MGVGIGMLIGEILAPWILFVTGTDCVTHVGIRADS